MFVLTSTIVFFSCFLVNAINFFAHFTFHLNIFHAKRLREKKVRRTAREKKIVSRVRNSRKRKTNSNIQRLAIFQQQGVLRHTPSTKAVCISGAQRFLVLSSILAYSTLNWLCVQLCLFRFV